MKYQAPYGVSDVNAPYINGNPSIGVQGSIPPAAAFEEPQRELVNLISLSGLTPSGGAGGVAGGDLAQVTKSVQAQRVNYAVDTGSQNAMVVALSPALPAGGSYSVGLPVRLRVAYSSINDATHTTLTLDAGCGPANVKRVDGAMPATGDLKAGGIYELVFDGTTWQVVNFFGPGAGGGGGTTVYVKIPYAVDTSPTPNVITVAFAPPITAPAVGDLVLIKIANTVTAATVITVNAIASKNLVRNDGVISPLAFSDMIAGSLYLLEWDGTEWVLLNPAFGLLSPSTAPFFPETLTNNGLFSISSAVGTVTVAVPNQWQYRAVQKFQTTAPINLSTAASKTYHLRWDAPGTGQASPAGTYPRGRFTLRDLSDAAYNPSSLPETDVAFDTTYDSMLVARVVTNSSNSPTVVALLNMQFLELGVQRGTPAQAPNGYGSYDTINMNWSRKPKGFTFRNLNAEIDPGGQFGIPVASLGTETPEAWGMITTITTYGTYTATRYTTYLMMYAESTSGGTGYWNMPYDVLLTG
jgi:hypothetical protein